MFGREMKLIEGREKEQAPQKMGQKGILCRPLVEKRHWDTGTNSLVAMFTDN